MRGVGRIPTSVQSKLLLAFAIVVVLLVTVGVLGINALNQSNDRGEALGLLPQRVAAYQELKTDGDQLNSLMISREDFIACVGSGGKSPYCSNSFVCDDLCQGSMPTPATVSAVDGAIRKTLDLLGPLTVVANLGFVPPPPERSIVNEIHSEFSQIDTAMGGIVAGDQEGNYSGSDPEPVAANLDSNAVELVDLAEQAKAKLIAQDQASYLASQHLFIGVAAGSAALALVLGVILAWAVVEPIRQMRTRLAAIASGDFSGHVEVTNRDELGALAADLNRTSDELGRLYAEVDSASRHKSEFLGNMSHELRTPLNAVIGFSEVLEGRLFGELNDKQAEYVADIRTSGRHLLAVINDILDLSKIEAGRMDLQVTPFLLADVVQSSAALLRERATRQGVALAYEIDPSIGVIEGDERMLKQVLFNLLTNALKFTPRGGHVDVSAHADGDDVVVSVHDDGIGIAPADQARIFEEFQQVKTPQSQEGTGLGLTISRRFIQLHRGTLRVDSELGKGTMFTFTIPRRQNAAMSTDTERFELPTMTPASPVVR